MFNHVIRELFAHFYNDYVKKPEIEDELKEELKRFIENYSFPCVGARDGFYVYISLKRKNLYNFNHEYSVSNMVLVDYNKLLFGS